MDLTNLPDLSASITNLPAIYPKIQRKYLNLPDITGKSKVL